MTSRKKKLSRRKFIVRTLAGGTGVALGVAYLGRHGMRRKIAEFIDEGGSMYIGSTDDPTVWFEISEDNIVTLYSPKVEMGQGTHTGLAQMAADELELSMDQIKVAHAPSSSGNIDGVSTGGSTSISSLWQPLRELSATMRQMLINEASKKLNVGVEELQVNQGVVSQSGGASLTYGQIVQNVKEWQVPDTPPLKKLSEYKYVGQPIPRLDLSDKVFGSPIFGMDAEMPNMLFGAIVRPSKIGARLVEADITEAEKMPGVVAVVKEEDFVGIVAESQLQADVAKRTINARWEVDRDWQTEDIEEMLKVGKGEPIVIQKEGNPEDILDGSDTITAEYKSPIGAHAQMEPNGAVAHVNKDGATIMLSTQVVSLTRSEVADRLGLDLEKVNIVPMFLGGGFGRRLHTPNAIQAAVLSKAVGRPVKCFFDRKEEFQNDTFRPPTHHVLKAKLKEDGLIEAIEHNVSSGDVMFGSALVPPFVQPIIGADAGAWRGGMIQYKKIPNFQAISWRVKLPFATSWWRSLGLLANTFAVESFMDELAHKSDLDPIEFRLAQIQDDEAGLRLKKVIQTAAEKGRYTGDIIDGKAMGFACSTDTSTPAAHVVEVSISADKQIKVDKVTCVIDPGMVVNPDQVRAQCEGSIIMGMSASLFERMYVKDGELQPTIYGPYRMALMKDAPRDIEVILLESSEVPGAVGEPPLGPIAAAIANAVFKITGTRLREMPLSLV